MRHTVKKDANHHEIVAAIERMGWLVMDMSGVGCGVPDLIVQKRGTKDATFSFVEIKNPKTSYGRHGLNRLQRAFAADWGRAIYMVSSIKEAERFCRGELPAVGTDMTPEDALRAVGLRS